MIPPARRWPDRAALDAGKCEDRGEEKAAKGSHAGIITTRVFVRKSKFYLMAWRRLPSSMASTLLGSVIGNHRHG